MKDALGVEVFRGDFVCHVSRRGSSISYNRKIIHEVHHDHLVVEGSVGFWRKEAKVTTIRTNFIKVPK